MFAAAACTVLAVSTPALSAPRHRSHHRQAAMDLGTCGLSGPNPLGLANAAALSRVTTISVATYTTLSTTSKLGLIFVPAQTVYITILHHTFPVVIPAHYVPGNVTTTTATQHSSSSSSKHWHFSVGQYVGTSIAAAAASEIIQAALTPCRQLTLSEAYANGADALLPFIGGWLVRHNMPDTPETYRIAWLAKKHKITDEQALSMYTKAYGFKSR